jgi:hypothetical protein
LLTLKVRSARGCEPHHISLSRASCAKAIPGMPTADAERAAAPPARKLRLFNLKAIDVPPFFAGYAHSSPHAYQHRFRADK